MKKTTLLKTLLMAVGLCMGTSNAWAQGLWDFTDTSKWSDSKFSSEATYGPDGTSATLGGSGITFNLSGKVKISQDAGMNFKSDASATLEGNIPTNNYIKVSVPAGYKAAVEYYGYNASRYLGFTFNGTLTTGPAVVYTKKEFDNSEGADAVDLYIYAVGVNRDGHARLLSINLVDMTTSTHSWTVKAKANISGVQTTIDTYSSTSGNYTTTIHEGENYYVPAKRVITYGDKKYELDDANYTGKYIYKRFTMGTADANHDISYKEAPEIVYYSEIEDATSKQHTTSNKASGGKYVNYMTTKTISDAFPAGKYIVEANMFCRKLNGETHFYLYASDDQSTEFADFTAQHDEGIKTAEFELASSKTLVYGNSSNSAACDYILIRKAPVAYTVEYKCGATVLKTADASRTAPWGTTVAITDADKENIFYSDGHATYQYASDNASSTTIASDGTSVITVEFTQVPLYTQTNVTDAETWDWSVITSGTSQLTDATTPKKNEYFILKNLELLEGYSIPAGFGDAQKLNVRGEYGFRIVSGTKFFQGANIKFTTEVPGTIEVQFSNTGSNGERHLTVNGVEKGDGTSSTDKVTASGIPVAAGDVVLGASTSYLRFYKIVFTPNLEVANAIADCKSYETSSAFATYIDGNAYATAAEVYAAHTAWQIENGTLSKVILNNTVTSTDHWWGTLADGADYVEAPDTKYLTNTEGAAYNVNQIVYQLPAGVYRASAWTYSSSAEWRKIYVSKVPTEGDWEDLITPYTSTQGWVELSGEFTLTEPANIAFGLYASAVTGRVAGFDNWTLTLVDIPVTISNAGFATYANHDYALDFTNVTGLKAYKASVSDNVVTFTPVGKVPAGTGLLLKGETANVPVAASADAVDNNLLYAPTTAITGNSLLYDDGENYNYILAQPAGKQIGFYRANNSNIAVGKAYLRIPKSLKARQFSFIGFDENGSETTGIVSVNNRNIDKMQRIYDLQGRRIDGQLSKGFYIVNGKKVIVK